MNGRANRLAGFFPDHQVAEIVSSRSSIDLCHRRCSLAMSGGGYSGDQENINGLYCWLAALVVRASTNTI
jgi:hypothetical protein